MKKVFAFISSNWIQLCWMIIALLLIVGIFRVSKEIHFLAIETRRVSVAIDPMRSYFMEIARGNIEEAMLKEAGFSEKEIKEYKEKTP